MIEIISGTNRPGNNSRKVARVLEQLYAENGTKVGVIDLCELPMEIFSPESYAKKPARFLEFQDRVLRADGLHIVVPEYNGSFPGVMKYFVDMLKFPESVQHRSTAYVGLSAGTSGNLRGVEQLQLVFNYRNAYNLPERVWISGINGKLSADGSALREEATIERLRNQVEKFLVFTEKHKGMAMKTIA